MCQLHPSRVSGNDRLPTLAPAITNPQAGSVDNPPASEINVGERSGRWIPTLLRAGVDRDNVHVDTASGGKASRPKLDLVMQLLCEGDTLKVTRLDRLSRSVLHLVTLGADPRERGIGLHVVEQGINTSTMEGRAMFGMLSEQPPAARPLPLT